MHRKEDVPVVGHYSSHPAVSEAHIIGADSLAKTILKTLFKACGWKPVFHKPRKKSAGKRAKGKPNVEKIRRLLRRTRRQGR